MLAKPALIEPKIAKRHRKKARKCFTAPDPKKSIDPAEPEMGEKYCFLESIKH